MADEFVGAGEAGGGDDLGHAGFRTGGGDVVADRAAKQEILLQHHAGATAEVAEVDVPQIDTVQAHHALVGYQDALYHAGQRGFAGPRASDDADDLTGLDLEGHAIQGRRGACMVTERHKIERQRAPDRGRHARSARFAFGRLTHDRSQHAQCQSGFLIFADQADNLHQRAGDAAGDHVERDQRADAEFVVEHQHRAHAEDSDLHRFIEASGDHACQRADPAHRRAPPAASDDFFVPVMQA